MLRQILSITGRPGLYKIVSQGNRSLIVEDVSTGKRFPARQRDRVVSLGDIAMYTESGDRPLGEILDAVYAHEGGAQIDVKALVADGGLRGKFEEVIPDYDKERVYDNDIKKLFTWYNLLVQAGITRFVAEEAEEAVESAD